MKRETVYTLLALAVLALTTIPVGTAVFWLGFVRGDSPCVMCWQQRTAMVIIALIGLFVLRYGPRPKYIGLAVLVGAWGLHMGIRHTGLHAARDVGQGFSIEILGAHTYVWSAFIFWACLVMLGVLLMALRNTDAPSGPRTLRPLEKLTMYVFLVVVAGNVVQAFASTGPPPFMGQGDPIRFSFHPADWVWSLEEWAPRSFSLRGRWNVEKPDVAAVNADPSASPLANMPVLETRNRARLAFPLRGTVTDLAYDRATDRFLLSTEHGIYITDGRLAEVLRSTVVDPGFSVDLGDFAGVSFLDSHTVMALGQNKSYVVLREDDHADPAKNYRFFLSSFDRFDELARSRLSTIRAKMMYVMSLAYDPASNSIYTITVPNSKTRRLVVSRFDRADMTLSEEYTPVLAPESGLAFQGEGRNLGELYVTGATIADGMLYALSGAGDTLLTIDLSRHTIDAAHRIPGLVHPTGIAARGAELLIVDRDGTIVTVDRPAPLPAPVMSDGPGGR